LKEGGLIIMADYKKMYVTLFRKVTKAIDLLQDAQLATEEIYISSDQPVIQLIKDDEEPPKGKD